MRNTLFFRCTLFILSLFMLQGCTMMDGNINEPTRPSQIPLGEIWADLNNFYYRFQTIGSVQALDGNAYSKDLKFVSMYREITYGSYGNFLIRITNIDIEAQTFPLEIKQSLRVSYSPQPNNSYLGTEADVRLTIESFDGKNIRGTMSGTLRNATNGQSLKLTNGQFYMALTKY